MANGIFTLRNQLQTLVQKAWSNSQTTPAVEYLVVAGGGGGGYVAGGGGAGGLLQGVVPISTGTAYTVTIGSGGGSATSGNNSVFGPITAIGGGYGGSYPSTYGGAGGSGGGAHNDTRGVGINGIIGQGVIGQGNAGGSSYSSSYYVGGGGGGAGTVGTSAQASQAGNGGSGIASAISGTVIIYSGGGGGGADTSGSGSVGGTGGGGAGAISRGATGGSGSVNGASGTTNTGGGGGGYGVGGTGGSGGSGIVVVSYPDTYNAPTSTTGSPTVSTSGSGSLSFNGSTQYVVGPTTSALNIGTGNFTVEFWVYPTAIYASALSIFFSCSNATQDFQIGLSASNYLYWHNSGNQITNAGTSTSCPLNQWNHIVLVRSGTNCALFCNGVRFGTATNSAAVNLTNYYLGSYWNGAPNYLTYGYMSNVRVSNAAIYSPTSSTLTTPTAPFTTTSSTVLLMSNVSGAQFADSSASSLTNTTSSIAPTWNQLSPFATGLGYKNRVYTWTSSGTVTF